MPGVPDIFQAGVRGTPASRKSQVASVWLDVAVSLPQPPATICTSCSLCLRGTSKAGPEGRHSWGSELRSIKVMMFILAIVLLVMPLLVCYYCLLLPVICV